MEHPPLRPPTLGEQLKDARAIRHLTLEQVEELTKVRLRHLKAIEEGDYRALPPDVFATGFVRRYAKALGLDPEAAAALFRAERARDRAARRSSPFRPPTAWRPPRLVLSAKMVTTGLVVLAVLLLFGYLWYQVRLFAAPPQLLLSAPPETVTADETVEIAGRTSPAATVFINNEPIPLDETGAFRQEVKLAPGINAIEVKAVNRLGKATVRVVNVLYETLPPQGVGTPESPEGTPQMEGDMLPSP